MMYLQWDMVYFQREIMFSLRKFMELVAFPMGERSIKGWQHNRHFYINSFENNASDDLIVRFSIDLTLCVM